MKMTRILTVMTMALSLADSAAGGWITAGNNMYADVTGNVGIGTTSPGAKLEIGGSGNLLLKGADENIGDIIFQTRTGMQKGRIWTEVTADVPTLYLSSGDNIADLTVDRNGNIGVGTSRPLFRFHVRAGSTGDGVWVSSAPGGTANVALLSDMDEGSWNYLTHAGDNMLLWKGSAIDSPDAGGLVIGPWSEGSTGIRITPTGSVGIGATDPNANVSLYVVTRRVDGIGVYGSAPWVPTIMSPGTAPEGEFAIQEARSGPPVEQAGVQGAYPPLPYGGCFESARGTGVYAYGGYIGVYADGYSEGIHAKSVVAGGNGGYFEAEGVGSDGVYGEGAETGVRGKSTGTGGSGGYFVGSSSNSTGVHGWGKAYDFYADGPNQHYVSASSVRWKRDIRPIDGALDKVMRLRGVYFNWIAEEVGKVLPEIVGYEENGIDATGMDYSKLTPLLVEAVKSLQSQLAEKSREIERLKEEVSGLQLRQREDGELRDRLAKLEAMVTEMTRLQNVGR
jgi:hypothetical protein